MTLSQNGPPSTYIWSCRNQSYNHIRKSCPALTSNYVGMHPTTLSERPSNHIWQPMSERLSTYIRPCEEPILHAKRALHLHLITNVKKAQHLHSTMQGTNPPCQKGSALTSDYCRNQCYNCLRMALHSHLIMQEPILQSHQNRPQSQTELSW